MKYLEHPKLTELTAELSDTTLQGRVIRGSIEAFTMKRAGTDKKLAHTLGQKYIAEMEELQHELADIRKRSRSQSVTEESKRARTTPPADTTTTTRTRAVSFDAVLEHASPKTTLGDFSELATRRLMTDLILTLNMSFPDYDFANVKPSQFEKLTVASARNRINERLSELADTSLNKSWLNELWVAINEVIDLSDCEVFSFAEDFDDDYSLWSFHYFFVNRSLRRIVFFTCAERISEEEGEEEGGDVAEHEYYVGGSSEARLVDDFDWDPSDNVAGGMALPMA